MVAGRASTGLRRLVDPLRLTVQLANDHVFSTPPRAPALKECMSEDGGVHAMASAGQA